VTDTNLTEQLWRFVHGELAAPEFEQWVYRTPVLEPLLGPDRYLELISADFGGGPAQRELRKRICDWLDPTGGSRCACLDWRDREKIMLGSETVHLLNEGFVTLRERNPWLSLVRCRRCGRHWYVAIDTLDDDYYLRRLSPEEVADITERDRWPTDFEDFAHVCPMPAEWDRAAVRYPWE
jgi:hypothetical protein